MVGAHGRGTYDQHESLRLRRGVLQVTLPTSREHITLTHSHSRTYTPKDIIRTQKINLLGKMIFKCSLCFLPLAPFFLKTAGEENAQENILQKYI